MSAPTSYFAITCRVAKKSRKTHKDLATEISRVVAFHSLQPALREMESYKLLLERRVNSVHYDEKVYYMGEATLQQVIVSPDSAAFLVYDGEANKIGNYHKPTIWAVRDREVISNIQITPTPDVNKYGLRVYRVVEEIKEANLPLFPEATAPQHF